MQPVLSFKNYSVTYLTNRGSVLALKNIDMSIFENQIVALVGESGSGKTTLGLSALRLLPPGTVIKGSMRFMGKDLLEYDTDQMQQIRGKQIGMIFQEPLEALNPVFTIGYQIGEALKVHGKCPDKDLSQRIKEVLQQVKMPDPDRIIHAYPHCLSGGLRQRAMIAQAVCCHPKLLIADEPTSSLDVTVQMHILALFRHLRDELGISILYITHDLKLAEAIADRIVVFCQGQKVEEGVSQQMLANPSAPYTKDLVAALNAYYRSS